jgi:hypothetical protein
MRVASLLCESLLLRDGCQTRYSFKYRPTDQQVVLKVTDDKTVLKFKTDQANDVKYIERLNQAFFRLMSAAEPTADLLAQPGLDLIYLHNTTFNQTFPLNFNYIVYYRLYFCILCVLVQKRRNQNQRPQKVAGQKSVADKATPVGFFLFLFSTGTIGRFYITIIQTRIHTIHSFTRTETLGCSSRRPTLRWSLDWRLSATSTRNR